MRRSHLVVSLLFCALFIAFFLAPNTSSQSTLRSLSLSGSGQSVSVPNSTSINISGPITVEAWIKLNSITGSYQTILSREAFQQTGTGGGYRLAITDVGKVRLDLFQSHNTYTTLYGATTVTTGVWHTSRACLTAARCGSISMGCWMGVCRAAVGRRQEPVRSTSAGSRMLRIRSISAG